jgi:hypothetical protein
MISISCSEQSPAISDPKIRSQIDANASQYNIEHIPGISIAHSNIPLSEAIILTSKQYSPLTTHS